MLNAHKEGLLEQLVQCDDPALTLHLGSLILFQSLTGFAVHASGKFVPQILGHLKPFLTSESLDVLERFQGKDSWR